MPMQNCGSVLFQNYFLLNKTTYAELHGKFINSDLNKIKS